MHSSALKRICNFKKRWRKFKQKYICFFVRFIFMHKLSFCLVCWDDIFLKNLSVSFLFIYFDGNQLWRIDVFSYSVFTTILTYFTNLLSGQELFQLLQRFWLILQIYCQDRNIMRETVHHSFVLQLPTKQIKCKLCSRTNS